MLPPYCGPSHRQHLRAYINAKNSFSALGASILLIFQYNTTVFDAVKYILLERICETFHLQIEWDTFSRGGKLSITQLEESVRARDY